MSHDRDAAEEIVRSRGRDLPSALYARALEAVSSLLGKRNPGYFASFADAAASTKLNVDVHGGVIQGGTVKLGRHATLTARDVGGVKLTVTDEAELRLRRERITKTFLDGVTALAERRRILLLLDDFELPLLLDVGYWLLTDVIARMQNAVVLIARAPSVHELPGCPVASSLTLSNLEADDVLTYLKLRLPSAASVAKLAEAIYGFSGGHPEAVGLAGDLAADLIEHRGSSTDSESLLDIFRNLPTEAPDYLRELVDHIVDAVEDPDVRKALEVAWVARRFDTGLLRMLLFGESGADGTDDRVGNLVYALSRYSFTESCPKSEASEPQAWRFHDFIREEGDSWLREHDRDRYEELHRRCARYFAQRMTAADQAEGDESSFARALRHDAPAWQVLAREWLYHLSMLTDRRAAGMALANMYLRVFYWYGWYEPYALCDRILEDWERTQGSDGASATWVYWLRLFAKSYPIIWKHQEADWDGVRDAMDALREEGVLGDDEGEWASLTREQRRLRAITDTFIAQSDLRREPPVLSGIPFYEEARAILAGVPEDRWLLPWVAYWLGQSALENNDLDAAAEECERTLQLGRAEGDWEAVACACQFRGDLRWRRRDYEGATRAYAAAIAHAFRLVGSSIGPDPYTQAFYEEMCDGTMSRIESLWREGETNRARAACDTIRTAMEKIWRPVGRVLEAAAFESALDDPTLTLLRRSLLLDLPEGSVSGPDLGRAAVAAKRVVAEIEGTEAADAGTAAKAPPLSGEEPATTGPQRLRTDLYLHPVSHEQS